MKCNTPGFPVLHHLPWVCSNSCPLSQWCPPNYHILCGPLLLLSSVFPSIRVFSNESPLHIRWPKYSSFSFTTCPSNEYSGLISFRIGWFDHLAVKRTLKTLFQHHSLKAFFGGQPSLWSSSHICTGKTIALTMWTVVGKEMSLLFKMLCRFVIAFLLKSKHLLISWLQSLSSVILETKKMSLFFTFSPSICHEVMGLDAMILVFGMLSFKPAFSLSSFTLIKSKAVKHS